MSLPLTLPTPRAHLVALLRAASDPTASPALIARMCAHEPGLTVDLLSVANSARYGFRHPIRSARQAAIALGLRQVRALVIAYAIRGAFVDMQAEGFDQELFWQDSLRRACAAQVLAQLTWYEDPDEAFAAGLCQDLGLVMLAVAHPGEAPALQALRSCAPGVRLASEVALVGSDHVTAFEASPLAEALPADLSKAVLGHHVVSQDHARASRLARLCALADGMVSLVAGWPDSGQLVEASFSVRQAGIHVPLGELLERIETLSQQVARDLNIALTDAPEMAVAVAQATGAVVDLLGGATPQHQGVVELGVLRAAVQQAVQRLQVEGKPFALLAVGGGQAREGRDATRARGERVRSMLRPSDTVSLAGGGRFLVLLLGADLPGAKHVARRLAGRGPVAARVGGLVLGAPRQVLAVSELVERALVAQELGCLEVLA